MSQLQYLRKIELIVSDDLGNGINLSPMRITFSIVKKDSQTPNSARISVYNLSQETETKIKKEFTNVLLQAGYDSNFGVIFKGTIKQVTSGREGGVDTFITIYGGDGDIPYNTAVVNATLDVATPNDQIAAAFGPMYDAGALQGYIAPIDGQSLPRGKVMFGASRDYLKQNTESSDASWSIQDGKTQVVKNTEVLPGKTFVLNTSTGLIGSPSLTTDGLEARCLLNPNLKIAGTVQIDEKYIQITPPDQNADDSENNSNNSAALSANGMYRVFTITHSGDSRGNDWYSDFTALQIDATQPSNNQVANNG